MRHSYFLSNMQQMTIQNNLDPVYASFKTIDFNAKQLLGGDGLLCYRIFFVYLFPLEKINQLKASKLPKSYLLT